jgi:hypothetical protein
METSAQLLNYPGNVKARIISKIVCILLKKFLHLPARCVPWRDNLRDFLQDVSRATAQLVFCNRTKRGFALPN